MSNARHSWIAAGDASRLLGVSRATLYAYVSRGFIRSQATPGTTRERLYSHDDVERLRRRTEERRAPDKAAAHALQWGMPVLESSIALIDGRRLYYRGLDAETLARSRSLEEVAALIWSGRLDATPLHVSPPRTTSALRSNAPFVARAQATLAAAAVDDPLAMDLRPANVAGTGLKILRLLTMTATGTSRVNGSVDVALARRWAIGAKGAEMVRAALVLCADHELNVSSFTARCVASAGSHPYAAVIAGLAALEGPKHGGASARVEAMLASMRRSRPLRAAVSARLRRGESIDGFGHPLYRDGDPRAKMLLEMLSERYASSAEYRFIVDFVRSATNATGEQPNLDFSLASVARVLRLPPGSPLMLFAIGRSVGWIGHAIEQYATNQLIRPRAKYVGVAPAAGSA
ncbi:MAG TPA: citrate/2-methylcitrate synthase [Vicinamibacterales bacterium]